MPLNLPDKLPAIDLLKEENIFVIDNSRASSQDIRPLKIVVLNLMPIKITTETDLIRLLSNSPLQIEVSLMKLKSHTSKNTPVEHMKAFYRDFELMKNEKFDGMIITGAPVEHLDFEDVNYWDEITEIFEWTRTHVTSTFISAGQHRRACIITMAFRNIRWKRKCSEFLNIISATDSSIYLFSVGLMMCFMYRTAVIRKSVGKTSRNVKACR